MKDFLPAFYLAILPQRFNMKKNMKDLFLLFDVNSGENIFVGNFSDCSVLCSALCDAGENIVLNNA